LQVRCVQQEVLVLKFGEEFSGFTLFESIFSPGGAFKFESDIYREMNMRLNKFDEISSLVRGIDFLVKFRSR
jgi:pantothenate kinase